MLKEQIETVELKKIIYGGQALGELAGGKKIFVWGGLPGETVKVRITKRKKSWAEGIVEEVITASKERVEPRDGQSYLSTSPWQILNYDYENKLKQELIIDQFAQHDLKLKLDDYTSPEDPYSYRNKAEFSFWWENPTVISTEVEKSDQISRQARDDSGKLDLAFFKRGTHTKQPVEGTSLAHPSINEAAVKIRDQLREKKIQARDLKSLLIRCNRQGSVIAELYVKEKDFSFAISHEQLEIDGFGVYFSNPKSPASVKTKTLLTSGERQLTDDILGKSYTYAADGFFQVTIPMYEAVLKTIQKYVDAKKPLLDMYSGVGSIGLSVATDDQPLKLVELDERCVKEAKSNAHKIKTDTEVVLAGSENALEHITGDETVIVDPPRAGLHQKVVDSLLDTTPQTIIYLSCNPATQARDVVLLAKKYKITYAHGFNFFPRTPHIENLLILTRI